MNFTYLTNEIEETVSLINSVFNTICDPNNFKLMDNQKVLLLKENNIVIGVTMITLKCDPIKNTKTYYLDYICIKEDHQHMGLGRKMFEEVLRIAKEDNIDYIELTSRKEREAARKIYQEYGMTIKDTDLFIKKV